MAELPEQLDGQLAVTGAMGVDQQMSALEAVQELLLDETGSLWTVASCRRCYGIKAVMIWVLRQRLFKYIKQL